MDKKVYRERMRRKQLQLRRRRRMKLVTYVIGAVLLLVFVVRGVILPIVNRLGGEEPEETVEVQAEVETIDPNAAVRQPLKGQGDLLKVTQLTPGWHEDENGKWYQNTDGTYYASGFQNIGGNTYAFDENGYMRIGWMSIGSRDFYFNEQGIYEPSVHRPMLAFTFDDGPGKYTNELLDCLEENGAHATFFMLGELISYYPDEVKRMLEIGCELGNHSYDHPNLDNIDVDAAVSQYDRTDQELINVCGQPATVARCPYGNGNSEKFAAIGKPFFLWSLDSLDWSYRDVDLDYQAVMSGDLTDGTIILMHDIHEPSVQAAKKLIPDLIAKGYKLVTVSEMAEAKGVDLQCVSYTDFWDSSIAAGLVPGYVGFGNEDAVDDSVSEEDYEDSEDNGDSEDYEDSEAYDDYYDEDYDEA